MPSTSLTNTTVAVGSLCAKRRDIQPPMGCHLPTQQSTGYSRILRLERHSHGAVAYCDSSAVERDRALLGEMPKTLDAMPTGALNLVYHVDRPRGLVEDHFADVRHRVSETAVARVTRAQAIPCRRSLESFDAGFRLVGPQKSPCDLRLIDAVDAHGVVRRGAAKVIAPFALGVVAVGARIDEQLLARHRKKQRQAIRMPVRGNAQKAERARVHDQFRLIRLAQPITENVVATSGERQRRRVRLIGRSRHRTAIAAQPLRSSHMPRPHAVANGPRRTIDCRQSVTRETARSALSAPGHRQCRRRRRRSWAYCRRRRAVRRRIPSYGAVPARTRRETAPLVCRLTRPRDQQEVHHELLIRDSLLTVDAILVRLHVHLLEQCGLCLAGANRPSRASRATWPLRRTLRSTPRSNGCWRTSDWTNDP